MKAGELIDDNVQLLQQLFRLLEHLDEGLYRLGPGPGRSVGSHVRHVLDHYQSFLAGTGDAADATTDVIDYDARERGSEVETSHPAAMRRVLELVDRLAKHDRTDLDRAVRVRMEAAPAATSTCRSTVGRELQFLVSHTVHHDALISLLLRPHGVELEPSFGVAPSTLRYWERAACAQPVG